MSKRVQENIVAFLFVLIFIAFFVMSFDYGERARMVPIPVAIASLLLILLQIFLMNFKKDFDLSVDAADIFRGSESGMAVQEERCKAQMDDIKIQKIEGGKEIGAIGIVLLFMVMVVLIGILPSIFLYVAGYFILGAKIHWLKAVIYSAVCDASIYFLFGYVLQIHMYEGWLINLILG